MVPSACAHLEIIAPISFHYVHVGAIEPAQGGTPKKDRLAMTKKRAQTAVVTGASSGIGREAAKALAAAGWRVIGLGRDPARSASALAEIRAAAASGQAVDMILA